MKKAKVIVLPLRRPAVKRFCQWQDNIRIDVPRAIRRHAPRVVVPRGNVIIMPKRRTGQDGTR